MTQSALALPSSPSLTTIDVPLIDDNEWISTAGVGFLIGDDALNIGHMCTKKGVEIAYIGRTGHMRMADLETILGPQRARTVRAYAKTEWQLAANLVTLLPNVPDSEAMRIVRFRGAMINNEMAYPRISWVMFITLQTALRHPRGKLRGSRSGHLPGTQDVPALRAIQRLQLGPS